MITLPHSLGDGLVLRRATATDVDALAAFHASIHQWPNPADGNLELAAWVRDLLGGAHPTTVPDDALIVAEAGTGTIVSASCLVPQTWTYGGIPIGVGRPELIATAPAYRRRGLVRQQMAVLHAWSAGRGHLIQGITGIPFYYRQFGYEPALALDGGRFGDVTRLPALSAGTTEPYQVRPATEADLPFVAATYEAGTRRNLVVATRDAALWRYELSGHNPISVYARRLYVIATAAGVMIGMLACWSNRWNGDTFVISAWELAPGYSWAAVAPSVLRGLTVLDPACRRYLLLLGTAHPAYVAMSSRLPEARRPYAWYLRVPDLLALLRHIAPVLERRLAASPFAGYSGDLTLSFFRTDSLRLVFVEGHLTAAESWTPLGSEEGDALFPGHTFLQLLFGYRSVAELDYAFADCWLQGESGALLHALFPPQSSEVWPIS